MILRQGRRTLISWMSSAQQPCEHLLPSIINFNGARSCLNFRVSTFSMLISSEIWRVIAALLFSAAITSRGYRKRSLSKSGAAAGFLVGFVTWACALRFGVTLFAFYLASTRMTRYKADLKRQLEDGFQTSNGNRSAMQVFASSLPAVLCAILYASLYRYDAPVTPTFPLRSTLLLAYMLFFAACAGDTFASELGLVLPARDQDPMLITAPWRRVPRGTNGGVSMEGTLASAVGGFFVGSVFFLAGPEYSYSQLHLVTIGMMGGLCGSVFDSLLGAVAQISWFDREDGKVLQKAPQGKVDLKRYELICGRDLLSGEAVNCISAVLTSALAGMLLPLFKVTYPNV